MILQIITIMRKQVIKLQNLVDQPQLSDYQNKPIQNYGIYLLKQMGYSQQKCIGKNKNNQLKDICILKSRPKGQGLGAQLNQQNLQNILEIGDKVIITQQPHKGLTGCISQMIKQDLFLIQLYPSKSTVKINTKSLTKISKAQMKSIYIQQNKQQIKQKKNKKIKWVISQIKVKIINPKSQYYLKKLIVTDLTSDRQFQCRDQKGNVVSHLTENDVQTVIPKIGSTVIIVKGLHKGQKASLIQRNKSKQSVTVQTFDELQMVKLQENDISQYVQI